MGQKFEAIETAQAQHMEELVTQAEAQRGHSAALAEVRQNIDDIPAAHLAAEARTSDIETQPRQATASFGASTSTGATAAGDDQGPCLYLVANVGRDASESNIVERATRVLAHADITRDLCHHMVASVKRDQVGSSVEVRFKSPMAGRRLRMWLRANPVTHTAGRSVWADVRKGRRVTEGARQIHRLAELLEEYDGDRKQLRMVVTKRIHSLTIVVGGQRAAYFGDGDLKFAPWARERYTDDERAKAFGFSAH